MREALLYESLEVKKVRCNLCNHHCIIQPGKTGICESEKMREEFYTLLSTERLSLKMLTQLRRNHFIIFFLGPFPTPLLPLVAISDVPFVKTLKFLNILISIQDKF